MTDAKLEDAERAAVDMSGLALLLANDPLWHPAVSGRCLRTAALLRRIPELQQQLKEQQQWATARHNQLESQLRDQVDKRVELHRQLAEAQERERQLREALQVYVERDDSDDTDHVDPYCPCVIQKRSAMALLAAGKP